MGFLHERASAERPAPANADVGWRERDSAWARVSCPPAGDLQRRQGTRPAPWPWIAFCRTGNVRGVGFQFFKHNVEAKPTRSGRP